MKVAIVTGAAKPDSIGHEVALRLLKEGMQVVVADLYEQGFPALRQCTCIRCDVADPAAVEEMVGKTVQSLGRIDVLVNCVGGSWGITRQDLVASPPSGFRGHKSARASLNAAARLSAPRPLTNPRTNPLRSHGPATVGR